MMRYSLTALDANKPISLRLAQFAQFKAGRLTSIRILVDTFDLVEQALGHPIHLPRIAWPADATFGRCASHRREDGPRPRHNFAPMCPHRPGIGRQAGDDFQNRIRRGGAAVAGGRFRPDPFAGQCAGRAVRTKKPMPRRWRPRPPDPDETAVKDDAATQGSRSQGSGLEPAQRRRLHPDDEPGVEGAVAPRAGTASDLTWSSKDKANGSAVSVKQPISPFWDTRIGADMTVTRQPATMSELLCGKGRQWRKRAAVFGNGMGGDHGPRRRHDLGQDGGRSPRRSLAGSEQARHLREQVAVPQRAIFAHPAERLQCDPAGP